MIWVLAIAVGLGSWLVLVGVPYAAWSRRQVRRSPGVFACRLRPTGPLEGARWPRRKRHARWVHDVLLVHRGAALARYDAYPVANVTGPIVGAPVRGMGERPVRLRLHLDDGRLFDMAAHNSDVDSAIGPFVVASLK